jgi:hypothetical protein
MLLKGATTDKYKCSEVYLVTDSAVLHAVALLASNSTAFLAL